MCRRRSFWQAVIAIEKILASCRAGPGTRFGRSLYLFQKCTAGFAVNRLFDRDQSHHGMTVSGQDDLVALLRSANQLRQLPLRVGDGYSHDSLHAAPTIAI